MAYLSAPLLLFAATLTDAPLQSCTNVTEVAAPEHIRFPIVGMRRNVWGYVVVEFVIHPSGVATDVTTLSSSSSLFERAATSLVAETRFNEQKHKCSHSLVIELTMENSLWRVHKLPAPIDTSAPEFLEWIDLRNEKYNDRLWPNSA